MLAHDGSIVPHQHDENENRRRQQAVDDRGQEQHPDGVDAQQIEQHPGRDRGGHYRVELSGPVGREVEAGPPPEQLGHRVGRRAGQHGNGEQPGPDDAEREQEVGGVAGQRTQCLGRLPARLDLVLAGAVERRCRREDDEVHDQVREEHPGGHVEARIAQLVRRCAPSLGERAPAAGALLLDFLRGLPEEQVRRDRRPQDAHERADERAVEANLRHDRGPEPRSPVRRGQERRNDVREQHGCQPLETAGEGRIRRPQRDRDDRESEHRHERHGGQPGEQFGGVGHPAEVRRNVEDVGAEQQQTRDGEKPPRVVMANGAGQAAAGDEADACADELDGGHERKRRERRPERRVAERGSRHRVRRDPAGIVVGRAGDEARSEHAEIADQGVATVPTLRGHDSSGAAFMVCLLRHVTSRRRISGIWLRRRATLTRLGSRHHASRR